MGQLLMSTVIPRTDLPSPEVTNPGLMSTVLMEVLASWT